MGTTSETSQHEATSPTQKRQRDVVWLAVVWARVVVGLGLAAVAGVSFGHAWTDERISMWCLGAVTLLTGVLLVLSALYARSDAVPVGRGAEPTTPAVAVPGERLVPLLGALLVYKYQLISHQQLAEAIQKQKTSKKRIGEILMEMGLITDGQLQEALEHQDSYRRRSAQEST